MVLQAPTQNRPYLKTDGYNNVIQQSATDMAFQGEYYAGTNNLKYKGLARPGASTSAAVWQLALLTYDGSNNLLTITWPQDSNGVASSEYVFTWSGRAGYTYS